MPKPIQEAQEYYRYCPGEERIKLSDAICLGRRRGNFPKCKGCPFNDEEKKAAEGPAATRPPGRRSGQAAKEPDRVELVFTARGLRAACPDPLDADVAWRVGHATAQFLRSELRGYDRSQPVQSTVIVGRDMRKSSPLLAEALIAGLRAGGAPVIDIGMVDTPQLGFAVNHLTCCGGVQVTASPYPGHYHGFSICGRKGRPLSADVGLSKISRIARNTLRHTSGQLADLSQTDLTEPYKTFVRHFLKPSGVFNEDRPLKVVIDASNGMAGRWFPLLFGDIEWLEVVRLNFDHNGTFVHDPNPLVEANLAQLKDRMIRAKADLGICFDGDASRCVVVDDQQNTVLADLVTAFMARQLLHQAPGSAVVYDPYSSQVVDEEVRQAGGVPRRERCGQAFIKKAMTDAKALLGGDSSARYYFRENGYCCSGMIAFAQIVNLLSEAGQPLSDLVAPLRRYARSGLRGFRNDDAQGTIKKLAKRYADGQITYLDGISVRYEGWWFVVRPSATEPLLRLSAEAKEPDLLAAKLAELCPLLGTPVDDSGGRRD